MYSFLASNMASIVAAPKSEEAYSWFTYNGRKPVEIQFRGKPVSVIKGMEFGVRKSANQKQIRLIFPNDHTRVFTITLEQAQALAKGIKK